MCVSLFSKSKIFGRKREQFSKRIFKFCWDVDASNDVTPTNVSKLKVGSGRSSKLWPTGLNPSTVIYDALGIRVWGCKMEGADKSTRQWALTQAVGRNKFCAIYKWPALIDWYMHNAILIRWPLINNVNTFRHCLGGKMFWLRCYLKLGEEGDNEGTKLANWWTLKKKFFCENDWQATDVTLRYILIAFTLSLNISLFLSFHHSFSLWRSSFPNLFSPLICLFNCMLFLIAL